MCLCTANSARSQMAEGFFRCLAGDRFKVFSAGTAPRPINPLAIEVMQEIGIDISNQKSKSITELLGQEFTYIITVCDKAKQTCPVFQGKYQKIDWSLEDPAQVQGSRDDKLTVFRKVRNQLKENIIKFLNLVKDKANLKCPQCGFVQEIAIPQDSCLHFYKCTTCRKIITPSVGSCCVICAYSDKNCPAFT